MKIVKQTGLLLLAAALLLGLGACGQEDGSVYTVIETVGEKQYGCVFRLGDKAAEQVEAALQVLAAGGELSQLSTAWLGSDQITLEGDSEALSALAETPQSRTLIVGVPADCPPLAYPGEDGQYTGMCVDMADAIGRVLGWEIRIQAVKAGELGTQLDSGNIDCALGFGAGTVSAAKYTVGTCYMASEIVVAARTDSGVRSLKDLKGQKIGAVKDETILAALQGNEKVGKYAESITAYLTTQRCVNALDNGWCAAMAMDRLALSAFEN